MKRLFIASIALMVCVLAQAQLKIQPKLNVGDKYVYNCVTKSDNKLLKFSATSVMEFKVSEKTKDGYIVDMMLRDMTVDSENEKMVMLLNITQGMLQGVNMRVAVDKNGVAKKIVNFGEVESGCTSYIKKLVNLVYSEMPELEDNMSKEELIEQGLTSVNEKTLMDGLTKTPTNPLSINGLTVTDGMTDTYINTQNMKIKRIYSVLSKNKFSTNGTLSMTKDEMKDFIIKRVEDSMPDRAEMIKGSIDLLMSTGMMKIDAVENCTYELLNNGWMKSVDMTMTLKMMGQNIEMSAHSELNK